MRAAGEVQVPRGSEAEVGDTVPSHSLMNLLVSWQGGPTSAPSELDEFQQEADLLSSLISFFLLFSLSIKSVWSGL